MTIKINYKQLPRDLARNIILEDNPYKDDTSFVGQMLKHSSWNDMEYFKLEDGFLKYIDENKSGYKPEVLPIMDNILQIYDKYFDCSYVDFYTCFDDNDSVCTSERFEDLDFLINDLNRKIRNYTKCKWNLSKTIKYNIDNRTHKSTIICVSGFNMSNRDKFEYLACIGVTHALIKMMILPICCARTLSEIYNPYKIYYISQDLDYLPCCYHHKDLYKLYKNNNATIAESLLDDCIDADFYKANNKMSVIISQKFHKDFYDIFDNNTGFVSKNKLIDLVNKHDAFALWFNDKSIEESEIEILYGRQVKIGDCNG